MRFTSEDLLHHYGAVAQRAGYEPVMISEAGEDRLVLMSVEEYRRLLRGRRVALPTEALDAETLARITLSHAPPEATAFDHEWPKPQA